MTYKINASVLAACLLAGCGGGGGGNDSDPSNSNNTSNGPSRAYLKLDDRTVATSPLGGAILNGVTTRNTTGTITHDAQQFLLSGAATAQDLGDTSAFNFSDFEYATDVELSAGEIAIIGVATDTVDVPTSGMAAYTGEFRGELTQSGSPSATALNWTADVQVGFAGAGDVDMTFAGGGSSVIDEIKIENASISGNTFSGGSFSTLNSGSTNNVTGTDVDLNGTFFGYDEVLTIPAEVGGVIASSDSDTVISGAFIASSQP